MKGIVWLASYPKSGNTWFRAFLTNFLRAAETPVSINELGAGPMASSRRALDEALGYHSGELTPEEIDRLRPEWYLHQAHTATETIFSKIHQAYLHLPEGRPLIPPEATAAVLYFVRNPLDVCVSYALHSGHDGYDRAIHGMGPGAEEFEPTEGHARTQLRQQLRSWSRHVTSWVDALDLRVHVVRYEDMKTRPEATFGAAVRFIGLPDDPGRLKKAIAFSRFEEMQRQELAGNFRERWPRQRLFFRRGEPGSWRQALSAKQVAQIIADHGDVMRRWGYLQENGEPVD